MRQMRIGILLGAVLALCTGMAFASDHRVEGPQWETGYGVSALGIDHLAQVATIAEAPRLREQTRVQVSVLLSKRLSPKMLAKSGHYQALEVAAVFGHCSAPVAIG